MHMMHNNYKYHARFLIIGIFRCFFMLEVFVKSCNDFWVVTNGLCSVNSIELLIPMNQRAHSFGTRDWKTQGNQTLIGLEDEQLLSKNGPFLVFHAPTLFDCPKGNSLII
jgi:hypothetical protein